MKSKSIFLNLKKYVLLLLILRFNSTGRAGDTLYYTVENVIVQLRSKEQREDANNTGIESQGEIVTQSVESQKDSYLIPFIIAQIDLYTSYHNCIYINKKEELPKASYNFLKIAINKFQYNLEYQFHFKKLDTNGILKTERSSSFFINPDNPEYPNTIITEIQKLFHNLGGTNQAPVAQIRVDGQPVYKRNSIIYRSHLDTIFLDGTSSVDKETPKKYLTFKWSVKKNSDSTSNNTKDTIAFISGFYFEKPQQNLVINEAGKYKLYLEVSDGVATSNRDSVFINISVLSKPVLELHQASFDKMVQRCICFESKKHEICPEKKKLIKTTDSIGFNIEKMNPSSIMVIQYLYSQDKQKKYYLKTGYNYSNEPVYLKHSCETANEYIACIGDKEIPGLRIDTCPFKNKDFVRFRLSEGITAGIHKYLIYTDFNGVTSNFDTLTIKYMEKSSFSLFIGYDNYKVYKKDDIYDIINIPTFKFGIRAYVLPKLSFDLNFLFPQKIKVSLPAGNYEYSLHSLGYQINYDFFPWKYEKLNLKRTPGFLSFFASFYQLHVSDINGAEPYYMLGFGGKPRVQLFSRNLSMGIWYLEAYYGFYYQLKKDKPYIAQKKDNPYITQTLGINLIYGFWNY